MSLRPCSPRQSPPAVLLFVALAWGMAGCTLESTGPQVTDSTAADGAVQDSNPGVEPAGGEQTNKSEQAEAADGAPVQSAPPSNAGNSDSKESGNQPHPESDSPAATLSTTTSDAPPEKKVPSTRTAKAKTPSRRPVAITFDDLELKMQLDSKFSPELLTPRVRELDGERVSIKGFIYAAGVFQQTGIQRFPLVKNTQCKFGPGGLAYCVILVSLKEGVTTNFTLQPVTVEGILKVQPYEGPDGITWSVYRLVGERVY